MIQLRALLTVLLSWSSWLGGATHSLAGPTPLDAGGVLGTRPPEWHLEGWHNSSPLSLASLRGKAVLIRWWTAPECPHCAVTAPSLNALHKIYGARGLVVIGAYHHKSSTPLDPTEVAAHTRRLGFQFPVAIDRDWTTLKEWWLHNRSRAFTSVTFLLDRDGVIHHVHPGGRIVLDSADYRELKDKIEALLGGKS